MPLILTFSQANTTTTTPHFNITDNAKKTVFAVMDSASGTPMTISPTAPFAVKDLKLNFNNLNITVDSSLPAFDGTITLYLTTLTPTTPATTSTSPNLTMTGFIRDAVTVSWTDSNGDTQQQSMTANVSVPLSNYQLDVVQNPPAS